MSKADELRMQPFDPSQGRKDKRVPLTQVARAVGKRISAGKPQTDFPYQEHLKFTWAPVDKCYINYQRQRYPEPKHIQKLHTKWNIICVTPLQARYSPKEDRYYIADGQQHGIDWVLQYGEGSMVPVFYVESEDENVESIQLLALNTDNEPMAKYFIHQQEVIMGVADAVSLEKCVQDAGCETAYKKRSAGTITHITDLWNARDDYGLDDLGFVLAKMRTYWPTERIFTANMLGFLKVKELMTLAGAYSDAKFEDLFYYASEHFESGERIHLDIKDEFEQAYPTNYKGMGVREKIASGLINVYEKHSGKKLMPNKYVPFEIDMPVITDEETVS